MNIPNRKEREFQRREEEILSAAMDLFEHDDWATVTVEQIAQRADIGKGTVYKHFASKDQIYARLVLDFYQEMLAVMREATRGKDTLAAMRHTLRAALSFHLQRPQYRYITQYCSRPDFRLNLDAAYQEAFQAFDAAMDRFTQELVSRGIAEGLLPAGPEASLTLGVKATFQGALSILWSGNLQHCLPSEEETPRTELLDRLIDYMLAGLMHQHRYRTPDSRKDLR